MWVAQGAAIQLQLQLLSSRPAGAPAPAVESLLNPRWRFVVTVVAFCVRRAARVVLERGKASCSLWYFQSSN